MDMGAESGPDAKGADTRGMSQMPMREGE
jgi:hypothetical protein